MKLGRETSAVEIGGSESKVQDFKIKASKEAFQILSSGLYNNQIGAIVRELSCNAFDSHVAAGKEHVPFEVHLPTRFEPFFSVTDFGVGLSEEQIYELYTSYFGTNKSDSNDFIGALGLGSKSPFSYCEGFTIVSKYNGNQTTYTCFINELGTPAVQKQVEISIIDEDEPFFAQSMTNGLQIQFPVKVQDIQEFNNNAATMLEFFNPAPSMNEDIKIKKQDYAMQTASWGIRKPDYYSSNTGVRAIQGKVAYSVGTIDQSKLMWEERELLKQPLDLFFPIGELSVAASRETLKNDERTIQNIIKAIQTIAHTYVQEMKKQLDECKNEWEAGIFVHNLIWKENPLRNLLEKEYQKGSFDGQYKNFKIEAKKGIKVSVCEFDHMDVTMYRFTATGYRSQTQDAEKVRIFNEEEHRARIFERIQKNEAKKEDYKQSIDPRKETLFVIGDIPFGAEKFIHHLLQRAHDNRDQNTSQPKVTQVYLIARANKDVLPDAVKFEALSILKKLGNPPFQYLSALKSKYWDGLKVEKTESVNRGIVAFDVNRYIDTYGDGYERKGWLDGWSITFPIDRTTKKFMIPKGSKKYYLKLNKGQPVNLKFKNAAELKAFIVAVGDSKEFEFDHKKEKIYGMPENSQYLKDAEKETYRDKDGFDQPEWVEFSQDVWNKLLKIMTPELEMKLSLQVKTFRAGNLEATFAQLSRELSSTSPIKQFVDKLTIAKSINAKKAEALAKVIAEASNNDKYKLTSLIDFEKEWADIQKKYPLLQIIEYRPYNNNQAEMYNAISEYIQMMDEKRSFEELLKAGENHTKMYLEAQELDVQIEQKENTNVTIEEESQPISQEDAVHAATLHLEEELRPSHAE